MIIWFRIGEEMEPLMRDLAVALDRALQETRPAEMNRLTRTILEELKGCPQYELADELWQRISTRLDPSVPGTMDYVLQGEALNAWVSAAEELEEHAFSLWLRKISGKDAAVQLPVSEGIQ